MISPEIVKRVAEWLGEDGEKFFQDILDEHGKLNVVLSGGYIPHPVHLREGMQVRNFIRSLNMTPDWNDHDYDNLWEEIVIKALKERKNGNYSS
jgi:hypothetical protein